MLTHASCFVSGLDFLIDMKILAAKICCLNNRIQVATRRNYVYTGLQENFFHFIRHMHVFFTFDQNNHGLGLVWISSTGIE